MSVSEAGSGQWSSAGVKWGESSGMEMSKRPKWVRSGGRHNCAIAHWWRLTDEDHHWSTAIGRFLIKSHRGTKLTDGNIKLYRLYDPCYFSAGRMADHLWLIYRTTGVGRYPHSTLEKMHVLSDLLYYVDLHPFIRGVLQLSSGFKVTF